MQQTEKLYRSQADRIFAGVCGGLGAYFDIEPLVFRAVFLVLALGGGSGILLYVLLAIIIPKQPGEFPRADHGERIRTAAQDFAERAKDFAEEFHPGSHPARRGAGRSLFGIILILAGLAFLLNRIVPISWFRWDFFWPVLIILIGIALLIKRERK